MSTFKPSHLKFDTTTMKKLAFAIVFGFAVMAATASTAQASIVYQYVADVQNFTGSAGTTSATVSFYLQETVSGTDTSYIFKQHGLNEAAFQLDRPSGNGWVNSLANQTGPGGNFPGGIGGVTGNFATTSAGPWRAINIVSTTARDGPLGTVNGAVTTVLLGTGTFNLGTTTSTFKLGKKTTGVNTQSYTDLTNLDLDNAALNIQGAGDSTFTLQLVVGQPGDYNGNGVVDAADYVLWRKYLNTNTTLPNDATPGSVVAGDYQVWRAHFGAPPGAGATFAANVPEPTTLVLLTFASAGWCLRRRRVA
jgi:PEP-CTERM motif